MLVMEALAQESFVRRIARHLRENFPKSVVELPDKLKAPVEALDEETLFDLVRTGIEKAKGYGLTLESSIAAFVAVMFEVAPNFDSHRLCQVLLRDKELEPDNRIGELLKVLTEKNWEAIHAEYDPQAWNKGQESAEKAETVKTETKNADIGENSGKKDSAKTETTTENQTEKIKTQPNMMDFEATVRIDSEE